MNFRLKLCLALMSTFCAFTILQRAQAQSDLSKVALIPSSAVAAVYLSPKEIIEDPTMDLMPRELLTAFGEQYLGVDPCQIVSVMLLVDNITDKQRPPGFAVTIRFDSPQELKDEVLAKAKESELRNKPLYAFGRGDDEPVLYLPNGKTFVFGTESFIKKMMSAKGATSGLIDLVKNSAGEEDHFNAFLNVEPVRGFIDENLPPKNQLPLPFQPFRSVPDEIESVVVRMRASGSSENYVKFNAIDEKAAAKVSRTIEQAISMGHGMLMSQVASEFNDQPIMMKALEDYDARVGDRIEAMLKPTVEGRTLTFVPSNDQAELTNVAVIGTLVGMLLPAVQQVRVAARRTVSMNNLRQICLASLNHESANRHFPGNIVDDDGKPLLSWRVAILPFIEENGLYEEFHLDEPWDSPHNIKLVERMPEVFRSPNSIHENKTVYLGFEGEGTMFDADTPKIGFANISDGSSNTILCVEANDEVAVEWSKPQDIKFDPGSPKANVGGLLPGGFNVVLADGSAHFVSADIDPQALKDLILRNDGNVVNVMNW